MSMYRPDLALSQTFQRLSGDLIPLGQSVFLDQTWSAEGRLAGVSPGALTGVNDIIDSKYRVLSLLGEGGMGSVYRVRHLLLDKEMALKTFRRATLSPDVWQRFQREAQAIARLTHLNIVQVFDFGIAEGNAPYYTMALLEGESLAERIKEQKQLSLREVLPIFVAVAGALNHAHKLGIVHRDVKPANIFLDRSEGNREIVKVVDFGLAKLASVTSFDAQGRERQASTEVGLVFGSPLYMSPEQADGKNIDARTDIYSFGCTLFEALTGEPPFVGENAFSTIQMHLLEAPPRLTARCPEMILPQAMENTLARLLTKEPADRYQTFDDVLVDLSRIESMLDGRISRVSNNRLPAQIVEDSSGSGSDAADRQFFPVDDQNADDNDELANHSAWPLKMVSGPVLLIAWSCFALLFLLIVTLPGPGSWRQSNVANWVDFSGRTPEPREAGSAAGTADGAGENPATVASVGKVPVTFRYVTTDDQGRRRFTFPPDTRIGYLSWSTHGRSHKPVPAEGSVLVPAASDVTFDLGDLLNSRPDLLSGFMAEDLTCVVLNTETTWNPRVFAAIVSYLPSVKALEINSFNFENGFVEQLNHFKRLLGLEMDDSNVDGAELARFAGLRQLRHLNIGGMKNASSVIQALRGDNALFDFHVTDCQLSDEDMRAISSYPHLSVLNINRSEVSLAGLRTLSQAPHLTSLALTAGRLKGGVIDVLANCKQLEALRIDTFEWSAGDRARLKKVLPPHCAILESNSSSRDGYRRVIK
jgi:serine/threonine protein kinase